MPGPPLALAQPSCVLARPRPLSFPATHPASAVKYSARLCSASADRWTRWPRTSRRAVSNQSVSSSIAPAAAPAASSVRFVRIGMSTAMTAGEGNGGRRRAGGRGG